MKATAFFDSKRFSRLMAYDLRLNGTAYLLKLAAFTLLMYIWILFQMRESTGQFMWHTYEGQLITSEVQGYISSFFVALILLGFFIGTSFSAMGNKVNRTIYLLLPASTIEKYLQPILIRIVLGTGLFFLLFWVDAQLARLTFEQFPVKGPDIQTINGIMVWKPDVFDYSMIFINGDAPWAAIIFTFISFGTFLFACPLFFRKLQLLKSILVFFAGIFLTVCLFVLFSHIFYPGQVHGFNVQLQDVLISKKCNNIELAAFALAYFSWLFFLVIGFFRLKESKL